MVARPDLVHLDRAKTNFRALIKPARSIPDSLYTGIWWYARFSNHYAGDAR